MIRSRCTNKVAVLSSTRRDTVKLVVFRYFVPCTNKVAVLSSSSKVTTVKLVKVIVFK
jgi:hypothetical protein